MMRRLKCVYLSLYTLIGFQVYTRFMVYENSSYDHDAFHANIGSPCICKIAMPALAVGGPNWICCKMD